MFECGLTNDARLSLDALCCRQSLTRFRKFLRGYPWLCLFLNIDAAAVEHTDRTRHFLADLTRQSDIPPANIAVEVGADFIASPPVWEFAQACRKDGYQLCVDKVCKKTHVLDILLTVRPEFVKLSPGSWRGTKTWSPPSSSMAKAAKSPGASPATPPCAPPRTGPPSTPPASTTP